MMLNAARGFMVEEKRAVGIGEKGAPLQDNLASWRNKTEFQGISTRLLNLSGKAQLRAETFVA